MKKVFALLSIALVAGLMMSCGDDPNNEKKDVYRIATYGETGEGWGGADTWVYEYDNDGKVVSVKRYWVADGQDVSNGYGSVDKQWDFAWNGKQIAITGNSNYDITLGDNGYVASMTEKGDGWAETYTYTYDSNGYMVKVERDGDLRSELVIENGCIKSWTRKEDGNWQTKNHTYSTVENADGIYAIYSEKSGASRWMQETGLFGKPCKYLCESNQWAHSDKASTLSYDFNSDNQVTKVTKTYDGYDEISLYSWEIKQ